MKPKRLSSCFAAFALALAVQVPGRADVPTPPSPPPPPAGYCSTIYGELQGDLQAFNLLLNIPPTWIPIPGGPTVMAANLQTADSNAGPQLSGPDYINTVTTQLQELKALGIQGVQVQVGFPVLYAPFFGGQTQMQPYLNFYTQVAQAVRAAGMKLIVENNVLLSQDIQTGWTNLTPFYAGLNWSQYMAARATMAATVAQAMQPDFLVLGEEPDGEAKQAGQPNVGVALDAAQMIGAEITAVRALNLPNVKLGAGFGSWLGSLPPNGLVDYVLAYVALPLDYIDFHLYPINNESLASFIDNTLVIASMAAAAAKPVAISEAWLWKMENSEWNVLHGDDFRGRDPFSFWEPLDESFLQMLNKLGDYANLLYIAPEGPNYLFAYQTYGGTTANGGAANCMCTTTSCSSQTIVETETVLANNDNQIGAYSAVGLNYASQLINPRDVVPPSVPAIIPGGAGFTGANFTWTASTDNVGVVGYNVYRCTPPSLTQSCAAVQIATTTGTSFIDSGLAGNTLYSYSLRAFDLANNDSLSSAVWTVQTLNSAPPSAPQNLSAVPFSPSQINLSWSPPQNAAGLSKYLVYCGSTSNNMLQVGTTTSTKTTFAYKPLSPATLYYCGVIAVETGLNSPMSNIASTTTLPLPNPPTSVTASPTSPTQIALAWQEVPAPGGLTVTSYQVNQGTIDGQLTKLATSTTTKYSVRNLTPGTKYYYEIVAIDSAKDNSVPSVEVSATTPPLPPAPTILTETAPAATQVALTWQWSPATGGLGAARYLVDCGTTPGNTPQVGTATSKSFTWRSALPATTYFCQVVAVDTSNTNSPPSAQVTVRTPPMPNPPSNVTAVANSSTKVTLSWTETIPPGGLPIQTYTIFRGTTPSTLVQVATRPSSPYSDTTVVSGTTYYYGVKATDTGRDVSTMTLAPPVTTP